MTAVEWLEDMIAKMEAYGGDLPPLMIHIKKAKEMENKQGYSEEDMRKAFEFYAERAICDIKYLDDDFTEFIKQFKNI